MSWEKELGEAIALHKAGRLAEALPCYQKLFAEQPDNAVLCHAYGILLTQTEQYTQAEKMLRQALLADPKNALYHNSLANLLLRLEDNTACEKLLLQAIELQPDYAGSYNNLGNCYLRLQNMAEARKQYEQCLKLQPEHPESLYNLANILAFEKNTDQAMVYYKKCLQQIPHYMPAQAGLIQAQLQAGLWQEVLTNASEYLKNNPHDTDIQHAQALALLETGKPKESITQLQNFIAKHPQHADAHYHLATAYMRLGMVDEALKNYLLHIAITPDRDSYYNAGIILMDKNRHKEAIAYFEQAIDLDPQYLPALNNIAATYLRVGKADKAIAYYKNILQQEPDNEEISHILSALEQTEAPDKPPENYVENLFDQYANHYDEHLVKHLQYKVPKNMRLLLEQEDLWPNRLLKILDLGCGTGAMGHELSYKAQTLIGVDLSQQMLDEAKQSKIYDSLHHSDILTFLPTCADFDVILAADVFTYIGNLQPVFKLCHRALVPGGLLCFSTEQTHEENFTLQTNVRYAHNKIYLQEQLQDAGFTVISINNTVLRQQFKKDVAGLLVLAQR